MNVSVRKQIFKLPIVNLDTTMWCLSAVEYNQTLCSFLVKDSVIAFNASDRIFGLDFVFLINNNNSQLVFFILYILKQMVNCYLRLN